MSLIEIRNLKKEYGSVSPLKGVNADIEEGEVISIIGPSGTGKSTLLRCINRLETPTSGTVTVDGVNVCDPSADLPKVRRIMGMVFQSFNLFPHKMAVENIMIPQQSLLGKSPQDAYSEAMEHTIPTNFPAVRSSASPSPEPLPCTRRSCFSTSRPAPWIPPWCPKCSPSSATWPAPA